MHIKPSPIAARERLRAQLSTMTTESVAPGRPDLDTLDSLQLVHAMNAEDALVPAAIAAQATQIARAIDAIVNRLERGGRLIYVGAGTSGRLGILDASECPPTFGTDPEMVVGVIAGGHPAILTAIENSEDDTEAAAATLIDLGLTPDDSVVGISASGRTPYVVGALNYANQINALTISVASNTTSPIAALANIPIDLDVGPEFISGSTRLKSGTAQKLVLNMFSTISMIKRGKTYNGVMVDLRATNEKLQVRSELSVMRATGIDAEASRQALNASYGSVKEAILMVKTGIDHDAAVAALLRSGGILRLAIADESDPSVDPLHKN